MSRMDQLKGWLQKRHLLQIAETVGLEPARIDFHPNGDMEFVPDWEHPDGVMYPCQYPPEIGQDGTITYPVTHRFKAMPDGEGGYYGGQKVRSLPTERLYNGALPPFYTHDYFALRQAIADADGQAWLIEGEPDVWTHMLAQHPNTLGIIGVGNLPDSFPYLLEQMGVRRLTALLDTDNAGWGLGERLVEMFSGHKIKLTPRTWRYYTRGVRVKDANDVIVATEGDWEQYRQAVEQTLPFVSLNDVAQRNNDDPFEDSLYTEIQRLLGARKYPANGWSTPVPCPMGQHEHDTTDPAAHWHTGKHIFKCYKCADDGKAWYTTKELARGLGIDVDQYRHAKQERLPEKNYRDPLPDFVPQPPPITPPLATPPPADTTGGGKLTVAGSLLKSGLVSDYSNRPWHTYMRTGDDALQELIDVIDGRRPDAFRVLPALLPHRGFQAIAPALKVPSIFLMTGVSGGRKTTFVTAMILNMLMRGHHIVMWSPEWNALEHAQRMVMQRGGVSMLDTLLLQQWYREQEQIQAGVVSARDPSLFGKKPDDRILKDTVEKIRQQMNFPGKIAYINQFGANALEVLGMFRGAHDQMIAWGAKPDLWVIDYAQMALAPPELMRQWTSEHFMSITKAYTLDADVLTVITSQSTKSDTRAVNQGADLDSTASVGLRDDQSNYSLTLNPKNVRKVINGREHILVMGKFTKTSLRPGGNISFEVPFWIDGETNAVTYYDVAPDPLTG